MHFRICLLGFGDAPSESWECQNVEAIIVVACRTAIGRSGKGTLAETSAMELAAAGAEARGLAYDGSRRPGWPQGMLPAADGLVR
jgi:hypothetical protein